MTGVQTCALPISYISRKLNDRQNVMLGKAIPITFKITRLIDRKRGTAAKSQDYARSVISAGWVRNAWVTVGAGVIKNGDYLCTSATKPGYLEKQSDDIRHSYTVGIARQSILADTKLAFIYLIQ